MRRSREYIRQWYKDLGFQRKLMITSLGVCMLPVLFFQIIFMNISLNYMNGQVNELIHSNLNQISERFSLTLDSYTDIVYQIYMDEPLIKDLENYHEADTMEQASLFFSMNERIRQFAEAKKGIRSISLICNTGESITYDNQTGSAIDNIWRDYEDLREISPYELTRGKNEIVLIPTQLVAENGEAAALFFLGKELYNPEDFGEGTIGAVIISIKEEALEEICSDDSNENTQMKSINFIVDGDGRVISFPDQSYIGTELSEKMDELDFVRRTGLLPGGKLDSNSYRDKNTGWTFYNVYDRAYMMRDLSKAQMIYRIFLLADLILGIVVINFTSRYFTVYLNKIMDGIKQVEKGNFDIQLEVDRSDEFGRIGEQFNTMASEIKSMTTKIASISEKKKQAEIKALEAQINPHFLYNTLDAINWMAVEQEEYEISKMLGNLGYILRYTLNNSDGLVSISEMEKWFTSYIALYQLRYRHSFEFQFYIEEEVKDVKIYKLLLQPILENAILHGIRDMEGGLIRVDAGYTEGKERVHLIVEDNGVGMDEEKVKFYNQWGKEKTAGDHIGLGNVFDRIQLYYGERGSWHISSVKGMGTIVEILLPVQSGEEKPRGRTEE